MSDNTACIPESNFVDPVRLRLRPLIPSDKQQLAAGFHRLSRQSRYSRFFRPKNEITDDELRRLTESDATGNFALGAFELSEDGTELSVVGVARYFRIAENPENAELAVAVVDDRQGLGIGRLLVRRLLEEARVRGIRQIIFYMLADNERMLNLIERVFGKTPLHREGDVIVGDFSIPDHPTPHRPLN